MEFSCLECSGMTLVASDSTRTARALLKAAWLSIVLGVLVEAAIVLTGWAFGSSPQVRAIVTDGLGKISWSVIVCTGLAVGTVASKMRGGLTGVMGLLSAPVAFNVARAIQKTIAQALGAASPAAALPSVIAVSATKGLEYALLGFVIGRIGKKLWGGLGAHLSIGLVIGVVFSLIFVGLAMLFGHPVPPTAKLAVLGVNELVFPVGCALVLYATAAVATKMATR